MRCPQCKVPLEPIVDAVYKGIGGRICECLYHRHGHYFVSGEMVLPIVSWKINGLSFKERKGGDKH
jgi:hypothetical protein